MHRYPPALRRLTLPLAALAGFVDAFAFSLLGGFFTSFMSGNTTRLGVSVIAGDWRDAGTALGVLTAFVIGVMAATWVGVRWERRRKRLVMLLVALLLALGALSAITAQSAGATLVLLSAAMGAEIGIFACDGEVAVGVTYFTGALVKRGLRIALALMDRRGPGADWLSIARLWIAFAVGGMTGTALAGRIGAAGPVLAAIAALGLALALDRASLASPRAARHMDL